MKKPISKKNAALVKDLLESNVTTVYKLILECWNHNTPHFNGTLPHRYDGISKKCAYCNRPIDWKPANAGIAAMTVAELVDGEE